jgi:short subunit dehydrogenase-like uncharacterized protein
VGGSFPRLKAESLSAGIGLIKALASRERTRSIMRKISPKPGSGPSEKTMDQGFFRFSFVGRAEDESKVFATVRDSGDPGNRATVKILCESALSLAVERDSLPGGDGRSGILTPATGLGRVLAERLREAGMELTVER